MASLSRTRCFQLIQRFWSSARQSGPRYGSINIYNEMWVYGSALKVKETRSNLSSSYAHWSLLGGGSSICYTFRGTSRFLVHQSVYQLALEYQWVLLLFITFKRTMSELLVCSAVSWLREEGSFRVGYNHESFLVSFSALLSLLGSSEPFWLINFF